MGMARLQFVVTFFAAVLSLGCPALAETDLSLDELLSSALANSPRYRDLLSAVAEKRAEAVATRTLPNPELEGEIRIVPGSNNAGDNEYEITLSQPLKVSYFGVRNSVGKLLEQAATLEEKSSVLEFTQSLKLVFAKAWAEQEKERLLSEARRRAEEIYRRVEASAKQGAIGRGEQKLIGAEIQRVEAELVGIRSDLSRSRAELVRLCGCALGSTRLKRPVQLELPDKENLLRTFDSSALPLQSRFELLAEVAGKQADLARRDAIPGFAPRIGVEHTEEGDDIIIAGVSFELPFFDRNQGERIKREAESSAARSWIGYSKSGALREEISSLLDSIQGLTEQADKFERKVVPLLREAISAYSEQLMAGQGVVFQIWETQRELTEAADRALELWLNALSMRSELSILVGEEI